MDNERYLGIKTVARLNFFVVLIISCSYILILHLAYMDECSKRNGIISGEVYLKEGGLSLADEKIKIYKKGKTYKTVTTNRKGQYKAELPKGKYTIMLNDQNYSINFQQNITVRPEKTTRCKDIVGVRKKYRKNTKCKEDQK